MMKIKRDYLYIAGIAIVLIMIASTCKRSSKLNDELLTTQSILDEKLSEIQTIRLENGRLKQEKRTALIDSDNKDLIIKNYKEEVSDLEENHRVKVRNIHAYYRATTETTGQGEVEVDFLSSMWGEEIPDRKIPDVPIVIDEKYFKFDGTLSGDKFKYDYTIFDSLSIAWHWEMRGVWPFKKRDHLNVSFVSANPKTVLTSVSSFAIYEEKKTRITIGPHVGYDIFNGFTVGVSAQYPLIRIRW